MTISESEKNTLLSIAREAIASSIDNVAYAGPDGSSGRLAEPGGAFVTIRTGGRLRGCIGYIESAMPLANVVREVAVRAAREDPRFPPLSRGELGEASLEVSVLSSLEPVADAGELRAGVHGLLIECCGRRGLLLPQVAREEGWDREALLEHTCRKAGLPPGAWKDPRAALYCFTAEVCDEDRKP